MNKKEGSALCVDEFALVVAVLVEAVPGPVIAGLQIVIVLLVEAEVVRKLTPHHSLLQEGIYILLHAWKQPHVHTFLLDYPYREKLHMPKQSSILILYPLVTPGMHAATGLNVLHPAA